MYSKIFNWLTVAFRPSGLMISGLLALFFFANTSHADKHKNDREDEPPSNIKDDKKVKNEEQVIPEIRKSTCYVQADACKSGCIEVFVAAKTEKLRNGRCVSKAYCNADLGSC